MRKVIIGLLLIGLLVTPVNALVIRSGGERNLGGASLTTKIGDDSAQVDVGVLTATYFESFTATETGKIYTTGINMLANGTVGVTHFMAIYNSDYSERIAICDSSVGQLQAGSNEFEFSSGVSVIKGEVYYIAISFNGNDTMGCTYSTPSVSRNTGVQCPDSALSVDGTVTNRNVCLWVEITY